MNKLISKTVIYRNKEISVDELKHNSNLLVTVECEHGQRQVRWNRRNQLCHKCATNVGLYNTSKKGRSVGWGDKISKSKKGIKFSEEHKDALVLARKNKICQRKGIHIDEFKEFPTKGVQFKLRSVIMNAIRRNIINKTVEEQEQAIHSILGYSSKELKDHLESRFETKMTWDNYGEWHIDHIKPESWFTYEQPTDEEFKKCWALDNLQPMWASQNIDKNNKYEGKYRPRKFFMLAGQFGVGKTTLCTKLTEKFNIVSYDSLNIKELDSLIANNYYQDKPILIDIPTNISTVFNRYSKAYDIHLVLLLEDVDVVKTRILSRNGKVNEQNILKRHKRMLYIRDNYATFSGTYDDVLNYLHNLHL